MSGYPTVQVWDDDDHEERPMPAPKPMTPPADAPLTREARAQQIADQLAQALWIHRRAFGTPADALAQHQVEVGERDIIEHFILAALRATEQETRQQEIEDQDS